jgi:lipid-binding SYLF domain-containing protein
MMFEHHIRLVVRSEGIYMSMHQSVLLAAAFVLTFGTALAQDEAVRAEQRRLEIDTNAQSSVNELFAAQPAARELYDKAAGYAVFTATKAGFIVSGGSGTGVAINKSTGQKAYMRMGMGGIGLGIGAQRYTLIVLFEDQAHLDKFVAGGWDSSATAEAAGGREGVAVRSSFMNGVAYYQLTDKGLMARADVTGTRFWKIDELN